MMHFQKSLWIVALAALIGCSRQKPCVETKNARFPGFSSRIDSAGTCWVSYHNKSRKPVVLNTYVFGYHVGVFKGQQNYSEFPQVPKPMPSDWVVVAPGKKHEFAVASYKGMKQFVLNPATTYRVDLYTPTDSPPSKLLGNGAMVVKPYGTTLTRSEPCDDTVTGPTEVL